MFLFDLTIEYRVIIGISAMVLLFAGFLISFITSQRKKLQYHKDLQRLNDQQQQSLQEQNALLEQRVKERTVELMQQKEALQASLTKLKITQNQLVQSEKMAALGELTAGIAHEIQNPLNFVNNFSEVNADLITELKEEAQAGRISDMLVIVDNLQQNLSKVTYHGGRASAIVRGMLEHSRSVAGQKQPVDVNALAQEHLRLAYHAIQLKSPAFSATLTTDFDGDAPPVLAVGEELGRVLLNLFNNAFYALHQRQQTEGPTYEPVLSVFTKRMPYALLIRIRDNGMGMPAKVQQKVFQPFFTTKPSGEGTGLGLSMSYDIITKGYGGTIALETEEGQFAEFTITLPTS